MKLKVVMVILGLAPLLMAADSPTEYYSRVERHLRSLPTLEVEYFAEGLAFGDEGMVGHMYWLRPDYFLHDTPEWSHCDTRAEQWRYLKGQNTLIRETPQGRSDWLPESILLDISVELQPRELSTAESGQTVLTLRSDSPNSPGELFLRFDEASLHPNEIEYMGDDGSTTVYRIVRWLENAAIDTSLFTPPIVPVENLIDFRTSGGEN